MFVLLFGDQHMTDWQFNRVKFFLIVLFISGGGLLLLTSCVTFNTARVFRSDEYIVYKLQKKETPETLAEKFLGDRKKSWVIEDANEDVSFEHNNIITIPLKETNIGGLTTNGYQVVPILCYHRFANHCKSPLCMPSHIFEQQMKYLDKNGYKVISFAQLVEFLEYRQALPKKAVIISIDDGYRSAYDIGYPILKKYGFTATLFVYTNFVGSCRNAITWNQLVRMKANGFEIGSHSVSHSDLTKRKVGEDTRVYLARVESELRVSKEIIDKKIGQKTVLLSFPYGRANKNVLKISERLGYRAAVTVKRGSNPFFSDPLTLKRTQILTRDMKTFVSTLKNFHKLSLK